VVLQPQINALRIGIYGGSYSGYLTAMGLVRISIFFAAGVDIYGIGDRKYSLAKVPI